MTVLSKKVPLRSITMNNKFIHSLCLSYLFYLCDAYVVLWPVKKYKEYKNRLQQDFWKRTGIDKQRFSTI